MMIDDDGEYTNCSKGILSRERSVWPGSHLNDVYSGTSKTLCATRVQTVNGLESYNIKQ